MALAGGASDQPLEQELEVLNPTAEQEVAVAPAPEGAQEVAAVDAGVDQEVGSAAPRSVAQKRTNAVAKFGVAVVGGAIAIASTVAMLMFL